MMRDSRQTIFKPMRFCEKCNVFRPPTRSSHCYTCGVCIIGFDHHCVWLGTCIGARNYLDFMLFLISLIALIFFCVVSLLLELLDLEENESFGSSLSENMHASIIIPLCLIFFLLVGLLLGFHVFLICKNVTTHEYLKHVYEIGTTRGDKMEATVNPFDTEKNFCDRLRVIYKRMQKSRKQQSHLNRGKQKLKKMIKRPIK